MNKEFLEILKVETAKKIDKPKVFVLPSLNGDTLQGWGQDVKTFLTDKEIDCYLLEFPIRAESTFERFDEILSSYLNTGNLNNNSIVICHSISNPYFIRFCNKHNFVPKHYIAVAPGLIYEYPITRTDYYVGTAKQAYPKLEDFEFARKHLKNITLFYSDEDKNYPEKFLRFISDFKIKDINYLKGYNHFDGYHRIYKIPELIELLETLI